MSVKVEKHNDLYKEAMDAYARATAEQNKADIYYIAMMSGIDLGIDTQEGGNDSI